LAQGWVRAGTCVFEGRYFFIIFALLDASKCDMMKTGTKEKIFFVQFGQAGFYLIKGYICRAKHVNKGKSIKCLLKAFVDTVFA